MHFLESAVKHIGITRIVCTAELSGSEVNADVPCQKFEGMREDLVKLLKKHGFEYQGAETWLLGMQKYSVFKCQECGHYMVDRNKNPAGIESASEHDAVIYNGAAIEGKYLCEQCLPRGHRWSFA